MTETPPGGRGIHVAEELGRRGRRGDLEDLHARLLELRTGEREVEPGFRHW